MLSRSFWRGIRPRIGLIVLAHALLVTAIFVVILGAASRDEHVYLLPQPERVAAMVRAFERAPAYTYPDLVRAFEGDLVTVRLEPQLPAYPDANALPDKDVRERYAQALSGRPFRIVANGVELAANPTSEPMISRLPLRVVVALPSGQALDVQRTTAIPVARFITQFRWLAIAVVAFDLMVIFLLAALTTRPVERLVRAVRRDDAKALDRISSTREFSELGRAFADMRRRLQALLEERTRIIAAVAHDYRTYLTRLELRSDFIENPRQRALAEQDLREMNLLLEDTLTFAQAGGEVDANAFIDVGHELRTLLDWRAEVRPDDRPPLFSELPAGCLVRATPVAFHRMIHNLLDNAERYGQGAVSITTHERGGRVLVCVEDNGPGVPSDRLAQLIEPFERLEGSRARHTGGVGLGLSIVQALAHRFGGRFSLENRKLGGLRACIELRMADQN